MSKIKVNIDGEQCLGTGVCVLSAPEVFGQGDNCIAFVVDGSENEGNLQKIREAVESCPTGAISLEEQ